MILDDQEFDDVWVYGVDKPDGMMVQCLRALLTVSLPGSTNLC